MAESTLDVVWPLGKRVSVKPTVKRKNEGLSRARIGFAWDELFHGDRMWKIIQEELANRWPDITFVGPDEFPNYHDKFSDDVANEGLKQKMLEHEITGAIIGVGACGSCTAATIRACSAVESIGIPTVAILGQDFEPMGRATAKAGPNPDLPIAVYPGPGVILTDPEQDFERKVRESLVPAIISALDKRPEAAETVRDDKDGESRLHAPAIVFSGDFDAVQEHFIDQGWSDGLPVVPPTRERVERFLAHTRRDSDEVLGALLPDLREATVWNTAVNGVMAGCRPEYMPILVAIVEVISDPYFHIQDAGSTPGWEPLITVSGPIVDDLGFNYQQGAMRVGRQANTSIGRFLRLYMRNVVGFRIPPGMTDGAAIGASFNVVMAEANQPAESIGWKTTREELGYGRDENIVFVQSVRSVTAPIYSMGSTPDEHLEALAEAAIGTLRTSVHRSYISGKQFTQILMNPPVAQTFAAAGLGRDYLREYLYEHCWIPVRVTNAWAQRVGRSPNALSPLDGAEKIGIKPEVRDGELSLPLFVRPENIYVIVGGNPGRNQSRIYFDNAPQGGRVIKRVEV